MKEKLQTALGSFGMIIWYIVSAIILLAPLIFVLHLPWIVDFLIIAAIISVPFFGDIVELGIWVWSFILAIKMPFDRLMIIYYIAAAIYVFTKLIPFLTVLFRKE